MLADFTGLHLNPEMQARVHLLLLCFPVFMSVSVQVLVYAYVSQLYYHQKKLPSSQLRFCCFVPLLHGMQV